MAASLGIFGNEVFISYVLPFALIFVVVFAILRRIKILGDSKQIDSIVSFIFALLFVVAVPFNAIPGKIIPVVGVVIVVMLVFMLMWGFIGGKVTPLNTGLRITAGILILITLIITILWATDFLDTVVGWFKASWAGELISSVILFVFIATIFAIVLTAKTEDASKSPSHP